MNKVFVFTSLFIILMGESLGVNTSASKIFLNIKYQNDLTLDLPVFEIKSRIIYEDVEKKNVTLYQYLSKDNFPVYYSRSIHASVCYDNQCRPLDITIYWNPTGRYLGFELLENEFLSKEDHVPFTDAEYVRLNTLLSDPDSPLGAFSYNQIAAKNKAALFNVDGVSGATAKDVLEYVVEGSAYTTFALYEFVYGDTKSEVEAWSNELLNDEYLENVLNESPYKDKLWVIERLQGKLSQYPQSKEIILDLMESTNYSLAEKCLNSVVPDDLSDSEFQVKLTDKFRSFDFGMRSRTVELLKDASQISPDVVKILNKDLLEMEVPIISGILEMYKERGISDLNTMSKIQEIADSENRYLSKKAEDYLAQVGN